MKEKGASKALWIIAGVLVIFLIIGIAAIAGFEEAEEELTPATVETSILGAEERIIDSYGLSPDTGEVFLYVQVHMKNTHEEKNASLNPFNFKLETNVGGRYNYHDQTDASDELAPGAEDTFWISFEIPEDEVGDTLEYEALFMSEPVTVSIPSY